MVPPDGPTPGASDDRPDQSWLGNLLLDREKSRKAGLAALALIAIGLFALLLSNGARFGGDTEDYIQGLAFRSPGYVWLLQAYNTIFGSAESLYEPANYLILVAAQLLFGLVAAWVMARTLEVLFPLPPWLTVLVFTILLTPYFFGDYRFGNSIQTEGICYPIYLIAFSLVLRGVSTRNLKPLFIFLPLLFVLVITRKQFVFVYPAFAIVLAYAFLFFPQRLATKLLLALLFAAAIIGADLIERARVHAVSGNFATIPFTGIQLIAAPLYFSSGDDRTLFDDDQQVQVLFDAFHKKMLEHSLSYEAITDKSVTVNHYYNHYAGAYPQIVLQVVVRIMKERGIESDFEIDRITTDMAIRLLAADPLPSLKLYFHNVKFALGGYYMMLFIAVVFGLSFLAHLWRRDALSLCLFLAILFHLGNFTAVAIVETILRRYSAYTETVLTVLLIAALYLLLVGVGRRPSTPAD